MVSDNLIGTVEYRGTTYTDRMLNSIEYVIAYESKQHRINGYDPDDVAQELRIRIWSKIHLYDPEKANFKTWSMRVIHNHLINMSKLRGDLLDPAHIENLIRFAEDEEDETPSSRTVNPASFSPRLYNESNEHSYPRIEEKVYG
jgi:RNA polymerase sigma factor (sigma-70 family)